MNYLTIAGRIGKDPEMRHLQDGTAILSFSVADDQGKDKPAIWWRCSLFGKRADSLQQYLTKGSSVTVVGTVSEREYTDKDGQQRKSQDVRVQDIALQGGKPEARTEAPQRRTAAPAPALVNDLDDGEDIPF
jgi:single-strand DNA-binding protein